MCIGLGNVVLITQRGQMTHTNQWENCYFLQRSNSQAWPASQHDNEHTANAAQLGVVGNDTARPPSRF